MKRFIFWAVFFSVTWWSLYTLAQAQYQIVNMYLETRNSKAIAILYGEGK